LIEVWKNAVGYNGKYQVSSLGRVRSWKRKLKFWIYLKPREVKKGYVLAALYVDGVAYNHSIHSLVMEAFVGPRPSGMCINHKNGDKKDNRPENLEYVTPSQNSVHALYVLGIKPQSGFNHGNAKLTDEQLLRIRARVLDGDRVVDLAKEFGTSISTVKRCRQGIDRVADLVK